MAVTLEDKLVIGVSSRALFDLEEENRIFEEQGLEIELINGQGADKVMTAVIADQVDIGFSGPEAAIYVMREGGGLECLKKFDYSDFKCRLGGK